MARTRFRIRRGFTLVELLVVMAIISLLLAVLLPALADARAKAMTIKCASNIKTFGMAFNTYASEYDGTLPMGDPTADPYKSTGGTNPEFYADWTGPHLAPFTNDQLVSQGGPNFGGDNTRPKFDKPVPGKIWLCPSYYLPLNVNSTTRQYVRPRSVNFKPWTKITNVRTYQSSTSKSREQHVSQVVVIYDSQYLGEPYGQVNNRSFWYPAGTSGLSLDNRHNLFRGANFGFLDGHVEYIEDQLTTAGYTKTYDLAILEK